MVVHTDWNFCEMLLKSNKYVTYFGNLKVIYPHPFIGKPNHYQIIIKLLKFI